MCVLLIYSIIINFLRCILHFCDNVKNNIHNIWFCDIIIVGIGGIYFERTNEYEKDN